MNQELGCRVCEDTNYSYSENFHLTLSEKTICVKCLKNFINNQLSDPNPSQLTKSCMTHNRSFDLFCIKCEILLCGKCIMSHRDHQIEDIDQIHDYLSSQKSQLSLKADQFLHNTEKAKTFLESFENFLNIFENSEEKNEFTLASSHFTQYIEEYKGFQSEAISELHQRQYETLKIQRNSLSRCERQEKKTKSTLQSLDQQKTDTIILRSIYESASILQKIKIFLHVKNKFNEI